MLRTTDPANDTLTFKVNAIELAFARQLAGREHMTLSAFLRATLADRIGFERSCGNLHDLPLDPTGSIIADDTITGQIAPAVPADQPPAGDLKLPPAAEAAQPAE